MSERTLKIRNPHMKGKDVEAWQQTLNKVLASWKVDLRVKVDGDYGMGTRSASEIVLFGLGFTREQFDEGITAGVRILVRNPGQRPAEQKRRIRERKGYRDSLRKKYADKDVAAPIDKILVMTWGWHPGVHDGIDLICGPNAPLHAICDGRVFDVRAGGWWGKNPSGQVWRGDGIIQIECTVNDGPFRKGMNFGYGHAEHAFVEIGQKVQAGDRIGLAGLAVAWHTHFMANDGTTTRGVGTMDPKPFVDYAIKRGR